MFQVLVGRTSQNLSISYITQYGVLVNRSLNLFSFPLDLIDILLNTLVDNFLENMAQQQQQNVVLECDGESVIQPHIRSWHVTSEELCDTGWDNETINLEQELYGGSLTDMELRLIIDIEVSRVQRNSIDHARILRYFNIVMGKIIQPEE